MAKKLVISNGQFGHRIHQIPLFSLANTKISQTILPEVFVERVEQDKIQNSFHLPKVKRQVKHDDCEEKVRAEVGKSGGQENQQMLNDQQNAHQNTHLSCLLVRRGHMIPFPR
jgi:hypothetical protein